MSNAINVRLPNGKQIRVENAESEDDAIAAAKDWWTQHENRDESYVGAVGKGLANVIHGVGSTVKNYGDKDAGNAIESFGEQYVNPRYVPASEQFIHPEDGEANHIGGLDWSKLPRAAVEQAPGLLMDIVGQRLVKRAGPIAKQVAAQATYGARTLGDEADKRAQARTGDPHAEPTASDKALAVASTALQGGLAKIGASSVVSPSRVTATGLKGVGQAARNVAQTAAIEGLVGAGQDAISQGVTHLGTDQAYDPKATLGAGVMGGLGGAFAATPRAFKETVTSARYRDLPPDEHVRAAANRIIEHAGGDTESLNSPKEAYHATARAVADVHRELGDAASAIQYPSRDLASALDAAKRGHALNEADLAAIDDHGDSQLSSLVRQNNALAALTDKGSFDPNAGKFAGGAHTAVLHHLGKAAGGAMGLGALMHMAGKGAIGLDSISAAVPHALTGLGVGAAGLAGLYGLDRGLGLASPAKTFTERFGDGSGVPTFGPRSGPTGPAVPPPQAPTQPWGPVNQHTPQQLQRLQERQQQQQQRQQNQQTILQGMPLIQQLAARNKAQAQVQAQAQKAQQKQHVDSATALLKQLAGEQKAKEKAASDAQKAEAKQKAAQQAAETKRVLDQQRAENKLAIQKQRDDAKQQRDDAMRKERQARDEAMRKDRQQRDEAMRKDRQQRDEARRQELEQKANAKRPAAVKAPPVEAPASPDESFQLPESPHSYLPASEASHLILEEAQKRKSVRYPELYRQSTERRLRGEEDAFFNIMKEMPSVKDRADFQKYHAALWGSDSPEMVKKVRDAMHKEFPKYAEHIQKHLSDDVVNSLWSSKK